MTRIGLILAAATWVSGCVVFGFGVPVPVAGGSWSRIPDDSGIVFELTPDLARAGVGANYAYDFTGALQDGRIVLRGVANRTLSPTSTFPGRSVMIRGKLPDRCDVVDGADGLLLTTVERPFSQGTFGPRP